MKNSRSEPRILPVALVALLLGAILAVLRGLELSNSFETVDMLVKPNDNYVTLTRALTAVTLLILAVCAKASRPAKGRLAQIYGGQTFTKSLYLGGAFLLCAAGLYDLSQGGTDSMARFVLAALSMLGGLSLVFAMGAKVRSQTAFFTIPPVFFACFWLVILYRDRTSSPDVEYYFYDMLATVAVILALYYAAAYGYEHPKPRRALFCSLIAVTMCAMVLGGTLFASARGVVPADLGMLGYYAASLVWALGAAFGVSKRIAQE